MAHDLAGASPDKARFPAALQVAHDLLPDLLYQAQFSDTGLPDPAAWCALVAQLDPSDERAEVAQSLVQSARTLIQRATSRPDHRTAMLDALLPRIRWELAAAPNQTAPSAAWSVLDTAVRHNTFHEVYLSLSPYVDPKDQTYTWSLLKRHVGTTSDNDPRPFRGLIEHPQAWAWVIQTTPPDVRGALAARLITYNRAKEAAQALLDAGALTWPWPIVALYDAMMADPEKAPIQKELFLKGWKTEIEEAMMDPSRSAQVKAKLHEVCRPLRDVILTDYYRVSDRQSDLAQRPPAPTSRPRPRS